MHVVATAGHVDHGKSTLVQALTGIDPDRFAEEKARGLTIDLGFAWATLPSGAEVGFVDVPGHVRFLKNMLAGVGAVDACLFVVAATEGWKPQSEEHLQILQVLGLQHGIVALTKVGLVDDEWREVVRLELADHLAGTFLEGVPIVDVDAPGGRGLDDLRAALDGMLAATPVAADAGYPRLWIDRSFAAKGSGTVVTGTLTGGSVHVDDELAVYPQHRRVRVRALQTHRAALVDAGPGRRLAVNLTGISHGEVGRGDALIRDGQWAASTRFDASLRVLDSVAHDVSRRGAYQAYVGSGEYAVRLRVLGQDRLTPGGEGLVRLHLPVALPLAPGDRYVLRDSGRSETVGGGEVLDVAPLMPASTARPSRSVDRVIAERGWIDVDDLERLTHERRPPDIGVWAVAPRVLEDTTNRLRAAVEAAGGMGLDTSRLDERERAVLASMRGIDVSEGRGRVAEAADPLAAHRFVAALEGAPFRPPAARDVGVDPTELRVLIQRGLVVERDGVYFAPSAVESAARAIASLLTASADGVTVSQIREALATTRKYLLPLLAHLDATGVTRRRGDVRIAGPRLPSP